MCVDYVLPKTDMYEERALKYFVILETQEMYETDIKFVASGGYFNRLHRRAYKNKTLNLDSGVGYVVTRATIFRTRNFT